MKVKDDGKINTRSQCVSFTVAGLAQLGENVTAERKVAVRFSGRNSLKVLNKLRMEVQLNLY